jgi:hypothetical protein
MLSAGNSCMKITGLIKISSMPGKPRLISLKVQGSMLTKLIEFIDFIGLGK